MPSYKLVGPLSLLLAGVVLNPFPGSAAEAEKKAAPVRALDPVNTLVANLKPDKVLVYKTVGDRKLEMHVFLPAGWQASDHRACFLAIHGGGWTGMGPQRFYPFAAHYAKLGMVGVSLQYRLANGSSTVFECVKDARSGARYLKEHAAELGIAADKLVACGGSAGGHLAAGVAEFDGIDEATDNLKISPMPAALVLMFPVIDTSKEGYGNAKIGPRWEEISPLQHVKKGLPPTILFHGTGDTTTPFKGAKAFHEAMVADGNRCDFIVNEGGRHGYLMYNQQLLDDTFLKTDQFLASLGLLPK